MRRRRRRALALAVAAVLAGLGGAVAAGISVGGAYAPRPQAAPRIVSGYTPSTVYTRVPHHVQSCWRNSELGP
jgi:hypothetical protein